MKAMEIILGFLFRIGLLTWGTSDILGYCAGLFYVLWGSHSIPDLYHLMLIVLLPWAVTITDAYRHFSQSPGRQSPLAGNCCCRQACSKHCLSALNKQSRSWQIFSLLSTKLSQQSLSLEIAHFGSWGLDFPKVTHASPCLWESAVCVFWQGPSCVGRRCDIRLIKAPGCTVRQCACRSVTIGVLWWSKACFVQNSIEVLNLRLSSGIDYVLIYYKPWEPTHLFIFYRQYLSHLRERWKQWWEVIIDRLPPARPQWGSSPQFGPVPWLGI